MATKEIRDLAAVARSKLFNERVRLYEQNPTRCKVCDHPIRYKYRNIHTFCGQTCSIQHKRDVNNVTDSRLNRECVICGVMFSVRRASAKQTCCSNVCRRNHIKQYCSSDETRKKRSKLQRELYKLGITKGWSRRTMSFPERYFKTKLDALNVEYVQEHPVGRYFVDFAFIDAKIALEIDGKQHQVEPQLSSDKRKDVFLTERGWHVIRIPWMNPRYANNKQILDDQLENVLRLIGI